MSAKPALTSDPRLPEKPQDAPANDWRYIADSFSWYDTAATRSRITYWVLKIFTLVAAAAITTLAAFDRTSELIAALAASVLVAEGIQQTGQFHTNYIAYRLVAENLSMHAWLFVVQEEPYDATDPQTRMRTLTRNVAGLVSSQNSDWSRRMLQPTDAPAT